MLEVDRSSSSPYEDNVYFCCTKFQGSGRNKIYFARSTDHGRTFTRGSQISDGYVQGCDIAVEHDGDLYVSWRSFAASGSGRTNGMRLVRSTDGGETFDKPRQIASFTPYAPGQAGQRDCGDGPYYCGDPGYVFHRVPLEPRITTRTTAGWSRCGRTTAPTTTTVASCRSETV